VTGGCCPVVGAGAAGVRALADGAGAGAGVAAGAGAGAGLDGAADAAAPTVTSGVIFSIVFFGTPALARSATDVYGRPAMIFFAVAGPTPGSASRSACGAELGFTGDAGGLAWSAFGAAA